MGSGAMIYIPSFIKISSSIQNFIEEDSQTHNGELINLILFFQNKGSCLKRRVRNYKKDWNWTVQTELRMLENTHLKTLSFLCSCLGKIKPDPI
jgi:hypothetical protein